MARFSATLHKDEEGVFVLLPDEIAFPPDLDVTIERRGEAIFIRPADDGGPSPPAQSS